MNRNDLEKAVEEINSGYLATRLCKLVLNYAYGGVEINLAPKAAKDGTGQYDITYGHYKPGETWKRLQRALSCGDVRRIADLADRDIREGRRARAEAAARRTGRETGGAQDVAGGYSAAEHNPENGGVYGGE